MSIEYFLILVLILFVLLINLNKKQDKQLEKMEHFSTGNFNVCDERDCECLKMKRAPDGTCTEEDISNIPDVPDYEDKIVYNRNAINNLNYPKKRKNEIFIFVGEKMKNKTTIFDQKIPDVLTTSFETDYSVYSNDEATQELFDIFERAIDIISYFDSKKKPYLKYIILNFNNITKDRKIMKSFDLDMNEVPAMYLYNEVTKEAKKFELKKFELEGQCDILERLLIFLANGDCGFLSYLNFLHDPYYGMKFSYSGEKKTWQPDLIKGNTPLPPGTGMCSLIDIENIPEHYKCKKEQL